jgi:uncharacterized protein YecA (UPF0149 family)
MASFPNNLPNPPGDDFVEEGYKYDIYVDPAAMQKPSPVHVEKKPGRNDPCPCGSGKKFKKCHGGHK